MSPMLLYAQKNNWPPIGTEWYYSFKPCNITYCPGVEEFIHLETTKDTIIHDTLCKKIRVNYHLADNSIQYLGNEFLFTAGDSVFNFHKGSFKLLYDYSVKVDDTLKLNLGSNTTVYDIYTDGVANEPVKHKVIAVDSIEISGEKYKSITLEIIDGLNTVVALPGQIVEGFGYLNYLTGKIVSPIEEINNYGPIRCFHSKTQNVQFESSFPCDTLITSATKTYKESGKPKLFPNPFNDQLTVKTINNNKIISIFLFDSTGRLVKGNRNIFLSSFTLNTINLQEGMYYIKVKFGNGNIINEIIIKQ
jgi:hypothetical protein